MQVQETVHPVEDGVPVPASEAFSEYLVIREHHRLTSIPDAESVPMRWGDRHRPLPVSLPSGANFAQSCSHGLTRHKIGDLTSDNEISLAPIPSGASRSCKAGWVTPQLQENY